MALMDDVDLCLRRNNAQINKARERALDMKVQEMAHTLINQGLKPNLSALRNVARRMMLAGK